MDQALPIIIVFIVIGIPVICGTLITLVKILRSTPGAKDGKASAEEARLIQEMNRSLNDLEERIETLETLIIERENRASKKP
jgi:hypothetical protein